MTCTKCDGTLYTRTNIPCSDCAPEEWIDFMLEHPGMDRLICEIMPGVMTLRHIENKVAMEMMCENN